MKKLFPILALASLSVLIPSCSDDTMQGIVDEKYTEEGILADLGGGDFEIPVNRAVEYTVEIPESAEWVSQYLPKNTRAQGKPLVLVLDENCTGIDRRTEVKIIQNGETTVIPVLQLASENGQAPSNQELRFPNIAKNKGLGYGYDPMKCKTTSQIFNVLHINAVMRDDKNDEYGDLISQNLINQLNSQRANLDSIENKADSIGVALSFDISYGIFKLGISGGFHSDEKRYSDVHHNRIGANVPKLNSRLDFLSVKDLSDEDNAVFTGGFRRIRTKINSLAGDTKTASGAQMESALTDLCDSYGPTFVSEATLGGAMTLDMYTDSVWCSSSMGVDSAKLTMAIESEVLKLKLGVEVSYEKEAVEILKHSNYTLNVIGGDAAQYGSLIGQSLGTDQQVAKVDEWLKTINLSDDSEENNAEVVSVVLRPIWVLFDENATNIVKDYVLAKYPDAKELDPYRPKNTKTLDSHK